MATKPKLDADLSGEPVDQTDYHIKQDRLKNTSKRLKGSFDTYEVPLTWDSGIRRFLGDKLVSWMSKKQDCTALTSAEAEYVALSASCAQVMWMRTQLQDYGFNYNKIPLYCDSQLAITISCNPVQHSRTKHIYTRYHFIKEQVENGIIELYFVRTEYQLADMFTKALSEDRFQYLVRRIGMRCLTLAELEGRMPTKIELTLEQSQQGVSNDVLSSGDSLNLPDHRIHKDGDGQTTKTFYKHQDSRIMKAQELKTKTSAQTLIYKIFLQRYQVYQGRLLASFQDDAKYEHVGQDTRSQGGKDDQDKQGKDLKISDIKKTKSKDNDKGSKSKITKHEGTSLQRRQRQRSQERNDKSNLIDLMKECHNELTSGEIVEDKGGSPRRQDTILGDRPAQTRFERLSKQPSDLPLPRVNTLASNEGSMTQQELMVLCTTLSKKVESLETDLKQTKQIYGAAYTKLIKKVKKLEKIVKSNKDKRRARIVVFDDEDDLEDPFKQGRKIAKIDQDPGISLVQHDAEIQRRYEHDMEFDFDFDAAKEVSTAKKDVSTVKPVSTAGTAVTTASIAVSTVSPTRNTRDSTVDDITMAETLVYIRKSAAKDKGKGKMAEFEIVKTKTKLQQEQERLDFEVALILQDELEEEERKRISRVHEVASSFNVEEWEGIQARVQADEELVQRLQAEEREKYTEAKQARMLAELINQRKRQKTGESSKLAEEPRDKETDELSQEELQQMMIIVPELGMNVEALQTKYPIIDWEIYTEGTRKYLKIIIVGNHIEVHHFFDDMPKAFDRDDLVMLWSLVKEKFNLTEPTEDKEREIWLS
ncbi:hypothetical protein Tco_0793912 [Tanacetum coccineum]